MTSSPKVIFVHGMNASAKSWNGLEAHPLIKATWGRTEAVTLAGHNENAFGPGDVPDTTKDGWCLEFMQALLAEPSAKVGMGDYISSVTQAFPSVPPGSAAIRDVILVGHSMGGAVISHVASHPNHEPRIRQLVYVSAMYPWDGDWISKLQLKIVANAQKTYDPRGVCWDFKPHLPDCASALVKQPNGPKSTVFSPSAQFKDIEKVYVRCGEDQIIPPPSQDAMLDEDDNAPVPITLMSSHLPQYAKKNELAGILVNEMKKDIQ